MAASPTNDPGSSTTGGLPKCAQRLNTDSRRALFTMIISSDSVADAHNRLMRANPLKGRRDRDITRVILHGLTHESDYNTFYPRLLQALIKSNKVFSVSTVYAVWDQLKLMHGSSSASGLGSKTPPWKPHAVHNLALCVGWLLGIGAVHLRILRGLETLVAEEQDATIDHDAAGNRPPSVRARELFFFRLALMEGFRVAGDEKDETPQDPENPGGRNALIRQFEILMGRSSKTSKKGKDEFFDANRSDEEQDDKQAQSGGNSLKLALLYFLKKRFGDSNVEVKAHGKEILLQCIDILESEFEQA